MDILKNNIVLKNQEPWLIQVVLGLFPGDESYSIYEIGDRRVTKAEFDEAAKDRPKSDIIKFC